MSRTRKLAIWTHGYRDARSWRLPCQATHYPADREAQAYAAGYAEGCNDNDVQARVELTTHATGRAGALGERNGKREQNYGC